MDDEQLKAEAVASVLDGGHTPTFECGEHSEYTVRLPDATALVIVFADGTTACELEPVPFR